MFKREKIKVILIGDLNSEWEREEIELATEELEKAGFEVKFKSEDGEPLTLKYDPLKLKFIGLDKIRWFVKNRRIFIKK